LSTSVFLAKRGAARYQVRAFSGEPTGFGTNFPMPHENASKWSAAIAQLVEHVIRNDGVTGSSPVCGTILKSQSVSFRNRRLNRYEVGVGFPLDGERF
jgi:hypothetical protein